MPTLVWPSIVRPSSMEVWIETESVITQMQRSSTSRSAFELPVQSWRINQSFDLLTNQMKRTLQGFLASMDGPVQPVLITDYDYEYDYTVSGLGGFAAGSITATGTKDAKLINLAGITGANPAFKMGDRIGIAGSIYMVAADANHVSGNITGLQIRPRLRADAAAAAVTLSGLQFTMQLIDDKQTRFMIDDVGHVHNVTMSFVEFVA